MGNLLLTRKHNLPISFAFGLARPGFETWMVIGLRTAKLAMGGPAAMLEAQRMVAEKKRRRCWRAKPPGGWRLRPGAARRPSSERRSRHIAVA
jgi:hypothetical protein